LEHYDPLTPPGTLVISYSPFPVPASIESLLPLIARNPILPSETYLPVVVGVEVVQNYEVVVFHLEFEVVNRELAFFPVNVVQRAYLPRMKDD
jgi:hypothetical protein